MEQQEFQNWLSRIDNLTKAQRAKASKAFLLLACAVLLWPSLVEPQSAGFSPIQRLSARDAANGDHFGGSISVSGNRAIASGGPWGEPAAVYIYEKSSAGEWAEVEKLVYAHEHYFGWSVAISGDRAIVGTEGDSAYVYERGSDGDWSLAQKLAAGAGVTSGFGHSVSISGDRALVSHYDHAAYIYERGPDGDWTMIQKLPRVDALADYNFALSVAISGDTVVVGAPTTGENGQRPGAVHVYERGSDGVWSGTKLLGENLTGEDSFGHSVSISGSRIIVGAYAAERDAGATYVYEKISSGVWTRTYKLNGDGYRFGWSVAISGDRAIVGTEDRSAYMYERSSDGIWTQTRGFSLRDMAKNWGEAVLGVSISGDTALIGVGGPFTPGSVYIYDAVAYDAVADIGNLGPVARVTETVVLENQKLTASDRATREFFGDSVSVSGDRAVVGAPGDSNDNGEGSGSIYVFERNSEGAWLQTDKLAASDGAEGDGFGRTVSVSGSIIVVGSVAANDFRGSAYVYERGSDGLWSETRLLASDEARVRHFGASVSISGSIAVVGAEDGVDDNGRNSGAAYVYEKSSAGAWTEVRKLTADDSTDGNRFGYSVSISGNRVIVGAVGDDDGEGSGSAYVFERGSSGTWLQKDKLKAIDTIEGNWLFGRSVSIYENNAVVGASRNDDKQLGSVYVFKRNSEGAWAKVQKLTPSDGFNGSFGWDLSVSGDRIIVGAELSGGYSGIAPGSAYVYERGSDGFWSETMKFLAEGDAVVRNTNTVGESVAWGALLGSSVAISGNRAIIGASGSDEYTGSAYVYEFPDVSVGPEPGRETERESQSQNGQTENLLILNGSLPLAEANSDELSSGSGGCAISADGSCGATCALVVLALLVLVPVSKLRKL